MRRSLLILPALLALSSLPAGAVEPVLGFGAWDLRAGQDRTGVQTCAMTSGTRDGRGFLVLWHETRPDLRIRLIDPTWRLQDDQTVPFQIHFDDGASFAGTAGAALDHVLEVSIRREAIANFLASWRRSHEMMIRFPGAGERSWRFSLRGSSRTTDAFLACIDEARAAGSALRRGARPEPAPEGGSLLRGGRPSRL